jgi:hypothetical protein
VAPDIEVRNDPAPVIAGGDPQLEAAVAEALRLLETEKVELKPEPAPPVRWRRPDPRRPEGPQTEEEQPQGQGQKQRQGQRTASETEADSGFRSPDTGLGSGHGRGRR